MSAKNKINLRPIWDAILDVYAEYVKICERHSLRYCADCGTAIGAVRHHGFIPWDDDMDIQMPRPDYEKFKEYAKDELPEGYAWLDMSTHKDYPNGFGKVIITDAKVVENVSRESGLSLGLGIFVDVFPLDGYPDSNLGMRWRKIQNYLLSFRSKYNEGWKAAKTTRAKMAFLIGAVLLPFNYKIHNPREMAMFYERRAKKYSFGSTRKCVSIGIAQYVDDKPYPYCFFGKPREVVFENTVMPVQENVDGYLRTLYGDYMMLPPAEARCCSHAAHSNVPWRLG